MEVMPRVPLIDISTYNRDNFVNNLAKDTFPSANINESPSRRRRLHRQAGTCGSDKSPRNNKTVNYLQVHNNMMNSLHLSANNATTTDRVDDVFSCTRLGSSDSLSCRTTHSTEVKSGNLVFTSPYWCSQNTNMQSGSGCSSPSSEHDNAPSHTPNRYPVMVKVHRKRFDHYAVVTRTKRHREMPPVYLNLNKSFVTPGPGRKQFTVLLHGAEGKSCTFEASSEESTVQWMNAFRNACASPVLNRSPVRHSFRDRLHSGSDTDSIAEEDEEEEEEDDSETNDNDNDDDVFVDSSTTNSTNASRSRLRERVCPLSPVIKLRESQRQEQIQRLYTMTARQNSEGLDISSTANTLPVLDESPDEQ